LHLLTLSPSFRSSSAHGEKSPKVTDDQGPKASIVDLNLGDDVLRERQRAYSVTPSDENLIVLRDLKKEFPPQDGNPKKTAVENMSLVIKRGECFGCVPPSVAFYDSFALENHLL
jgi:ABC-type glutathione transport system ATPase component